MLTTYDRAWSFVGMPLVLASISFAIFARTGTFPLIAPSPVGDALRITAGYYGLVITSGGLFMLGFIALQYLNHCPENRLVEPPWPRFVPIEENGRERVISTAIFFGLVGIPFGMWFLFLLRYLDSRISPWSAGSIDGAMGEGFISSRFALFSHSCSVEPCWRFYPPDGHQYISWLNDPLILLLSLAAISTWILWMVRILQH